MNSIPVRMMGAALQKLVPIGRPGNPADFLTALQNIEVELSFVEGSVLHDENGIPLTSVLDGVLTVDEQRELLDAVRVMRGFHFLKISCSAVSVPFSPWQRVWDLAELERIFRTALNPITKQVFPSLTSDSDNRVLEATRLVCLWSALLLLAAECVLLKMKLQTRNNRHPRFFA